MTLCTEKCKATNDREHKGTSDDPKQFPFVGYGRVAYDLIDMIHECIDDNENLDDRDYRSVLDSYGLPDEESVLVADISQCDARCTLAIIFTIVRGDRFCEGLLLSYLDDGMMLKWMKRLKEIDDEQTLGQFVPAFGLPIVRNRKGNLSEVG